MKVPGTYRSSEVYQGPIPGTFEPGFVEPPIQQQPVSVELRQIVQGEQRLELDRFSFGDCRVLRGREPQGVNGEMRWHLTISCADRHPNWDEIKLARYRLLPHDVCFAMLLPPPPDYVNVPEQDHVFQLWEIDDPARVWEVG